MSEIMQRIIDTMKKRNMKDKDLCQATSIKQSTFATWKQKNRDPKPEHLNKIAKCLGVSVDYLMTGKRNSQEDWQPTITEKDEKDIRKALESVKNQLSTGTGLMYDGEPMDEESREAVLAAVEVAERTAILAAKKKYTPKKYRK